jgi:hypothetical protein
MRGKGTGWLGIVALAGLLALPAVALATDDPGSFGGRHWGTRKVPFTIGVGNNVSRDWQKYLDRAVADWSESGTVTLEIIRGSTSPKKCEAVEGRIEVCSGNYGDTGWLGLSRVRLENDFFSAVTVQVNDYYFKEKGGIYNTRKARVHTMCHELGHAVGLPHPDDSSKSCVNDSLDMLESTLEPTKGDFKDLRKLYGNGDRFQTVERNPRLAPLTPEIRVAGPLPEIRIGAPGSETVQVDTLPDGSTLITRVTWAE